MRRTILRVVALFDLVAALLPPFDWGSVFLLILGAIAFGASFDEGD